jgi:glutamate synthase (NADPH/NADH) small chain
MGGSNSKVTNGRQEPRRLPVVQRTSNWREFYEPNSEEVVRTQGARCMDCGVAFCQGDTGCPVQNVIPEWNALVREGRWRPALDALHATNNFPELTGRLCPAPCESACVLGLVEEPVTIRHIEQAIADRGFAEGWIAPAPPREVTDRSVAIVGSGPAGLSAAQQLRRRGHRVVVFEKADRVGGLLRYGIPDFKLEKRVLDARLRQLTSEGVIFETGVDVGTDVSAEALRRDFDAVVLAIGARQPRDLAVAGRELAGIELAMDFLTLQNRRVAGDRIDVGPRLSATGQRVVVIGGGDTGSDCVGTCHRQGAVHVRQIELLQQPPLSRDPSTPWPLWPLQLRTSHAHEEGGVRQWSLSTTRFSGEDGRVQAVHAETSGPERSASVLPADLVLLAMGFTGVEDAPLLHELGVRIGPRGAIATDAHSMTNVDGVFAAGDARRGASLIVWAIREGRDVADAVEQYLRQPAEVHSR